MNRDWTICGWRVRSDIPLPEALPWRGPASAPVDITVRLGEVPETMPHAVHTERVAAVAPDGTYLFGLPRVGRYLVRGGREVVVRPWGPMDEPDVRLFVETNCLAALVLQRGLIPLHGSVVRVHGRTVAIVGASGQGKSTLAAAVAARGHRFLAEDVCVLDDASPAGAPPTVIPTLPNIRLWADALERMEIDTGTLCRSRRHLEKYHLVRPDWFHDRPEPLDAVVLLREATETETPEGLSRLAGAKQVSAVVGQVLRPKLAEVLGMERRVLALALGLARSGRVHVLGAARDRARLVEAAELIERLAEEMSP